MMNKKPLKIYVASSWRNPNQFHIVSLLESEGYDVYDFRNPMEGEKGFHWSDIDTDWEQWGPDQFIASLNHPIAVAGFNLDFRAMCWADVCVMVMPCGRSAHLEAGFFVGANKPLYILLSDGEPELMYKMASALCSDEDELLMLLRKRVNLSYTKIGGL